MATYNLCIVHQMQEAQIFDELMGAFAYGLQAKGHIVYASVNSLRKDAINIILGAHISPASISPQLLPDTIIFNTEQVGSVWFTDHYIELLMKYKVWDYSLFNMDLLKKAYGLTNVTYNPVGYCPLLERITHKPEAEKDIDVLLYGAVNERRRNIIQSLLDKKVKAMFVYDAFGDNRDKLIARSKIILNVHYYDMAILETVRLSYLLNNKCFVITERSRDWKLCDNYWYTMVMSDYGWIVEDCLEYLKAPERRENVAQCGHLIFKESKQEELICLN